MLRFRVVTSVVRRGAARQANDRRHGLSRRPDPRLGPSATESLKGCARFSPGADFPLLDSLRDTHRGSRPVKAFPPESEQFAGTKGVRHIQFEKESISDTQFRRSRAQLRPRQYRFVSIAKLRWHPHLTGGVFGEEVLIDRLGEDVRRYARILSTLSSWSSPAY